MDFSSLSQHFTTPPTYWTHKEISTWLELLNMKEYQNEFEINKVDGLIIFDLDDKEIEEILCIKNSIHRKRLRNGINILRQFQDELERRKKGGDQVEGYGGEFGNTSSLATSVLNSQSAKLYSMKNNQFSQFNNQTAQRRELENVFNTNALAHFDTEVNYQLPRSYQMEQKIEEEKDIDTFFAKENAGVVNISSKNKPRKGEKAYEQPLAVNNSNASPQVNPTSMNIEDEERTNKHFSDQKGSRKVRKSLSAMEDPFRSPSENKLSPLNALHHSGSQGNLGDVNSQADPFKALGQNLQPAIVQTYSAELIIQPVDGVNSNNFYCINESGGRIGRHSNNEIVIFEESVSRYHSVIECHENKFYLIDIGSTTGSFLKIVTPLILEENMILEMGSNQFLVDQIIIKDDENGVLHLKTIEGMHADREFIIENTATIGRKGQFTPTTITFVDDLHLSNTHTKISVIEGQFVLEDLGSTNGSWLRLSPEGTRSKPYELVDGTFFKIGASSTFKVKRSNTNYLEMMQSPKNYDGTMNCAVCYENDRDVVFIPCKHNVVCIKCSKNIKQCPVCRIKINDIIRIYKS